MDRCVPAAQIRVHVVTEAVALALVPVLWGIGGNPGLSQMERLTIRGLAVGTLLVDGWLLYRNVSGKVTTC